MNNVDKIKKLNAHSLACILMCPGEFDDEFKKKIAIWVIALNA